MFGMVMEWGLKNEGSFAIEASFGPAFVWGESEHFYGAVHVDDHSERGHDDHAESTMIMTTTKITMTTRIMMTMPGRSR